MSVNESWATRPLAGSFAPTGLNTYLNGFPRVAFSAFRGSLHPGLTSTPPPGASAVQSEQR